MKPLFFIVALMSPLPCCQPQADHLFGSEDGNNIPADTSLVSLIETSIYHDGSDLLPSGQAALLYANGVFVDSTYVEPPPIYITNLGILYRIWGGANWSEFAFYDSKRIHLASSILPYFDIFSEPLIIDDQLYYWGFDIPNVYAVLFDVNSGNATTSFVKEDYLETDFSLYFKPRKDNGCILFVSDVEVYRFSRDLVPK